VLAECTSFNDKSGGALSNHRLKVVKLIMLGTESSACHVARTAYLSNM